MRVFRRGFVNRIPKRPLGKAGPGVAQSFSGRPRLRESLSWRGGDLSLNTETREGKGALACIVTGSEY